MVVTLPGICHRSWCGRGLHRKVEYMPQRYSLMTALRRILFHATSDHTP